jgi:response regulator RpfG family c-di-GMP phosphodiesterase
MTTLIISPDPTWSSWAQQAFIIQGLPCEVAHTGKEAQLKAYQKKYNYFVLDLEVQHHDGIEVCTYIRKTCPQSKLVLTISSTKRLDELFLDEKKLLKMGVTKLLYQPAPGTIVNEIKAIGQIRKWNNSAETTTAKTPIKDVDEAIDDGEFSRIKITDIFENTAAIFDYYLRLGSNRFIKIIHKGETPSREQLDKYASSGTAFLFFMKKDRAAFISYQNDLAKESLKNSPGESSKVIKAMKSTTDKYFEEVFTVGIQPNLIEEGKAICQNMYDAAIQDEGLKKFVNDLEQFNPAALSHAFLISFFSTLICKDLDWVGPKSVQTLALGALFHDIGLLQLPPELQEMDVALMTAEQKAIYETHPTLGADALKNIPGINVGVLQIVLQHHEHVNGSGYPAGLAGHKIYPLAKVVALADSFSYFLKENELSPIEGLRKFVREQNNLVWYDPMLVKNLIKALK